MIFLYIIQKITSSCTQISRKTQVITMNLSVQRVFFFFKASVNIYIYIYIAFD